MTSWDSSRAQAYLDMQTQNDVAYAPFDYALLSALQPRPGHSVLDVGCGAGSTSRVFARAVGAAGKVVGIDIAEPMVTVARDAASSEGLTNITTICADAQTAALAEAPFDAIVSRLGVMFFDDFVTAFSNMRQMLTDGGRLAFVCWQTFEKSMRYEVFRLLRQYVSSVDDFVADQFRLSDPLFTANVLERSGYEAISLKSLDDRLILGAGRGLEAAFDHLMGTRTLGTMYNELDATSRAEARSEILRFLENHETPRGVAVPASVWLVTASNG